MGDQWVTVRDGDDFLSGAVPAMDRGLLSNDPDFTHSYVALWNNKGKPVFGKATNRKGIISASFPSEMGTIRSSEIPSFHLLQYVGSPETNKFCYTWIMIAELARNKPPLASPLKIDTAAPAVVGVGRNDERLGHADLRKAYVLASQDDGAVAQYVNGAYAEAYILCKVHAANLV